MASSKILKNSLFLYVRMFFLLGITLYSTRILLIGLGVENYGIYNLVWGLVTMMGFLNGSIASASQRYLSYDLGTNQLEKLRKTFSTTIHIQCLLTVVMILIAETIGIWYINNKMYFPENTQFSINYVFQLAIISLLFNMLQIPYMSLVIAREKMSFYSFITVCDGILKLIAAVMLTYLQENLLIIYSCLICLISACTFIGYFTYCRNSFSESKLIKINDSAYLKEILAFSGWNLFGNIAAIARNQGVNVLLNIFFGIAINAAYSLTMLVQSAVNMFVNSFQMAINPQIIKQYASNNKAKSIEYMYFSTKISFFLISLVIFPLLLHTEYILQLWLHNIPSYTLQFVQICLITILIDTLASPLMIMFQATGKIKWYQIIVGSLIFLTLPITYILFESNIIEDIDPNTPFYVILIISILSYMVRLYMLKRHINLQIVDYIKQVLIRVAFLTLILITSNLLLNLNEYQFHSIYEFFYLVCLELILILFSTLIFGLNKQEKMHLINLITIKLKH